MSAVSARVPALADLRRCWRMRGSCRLSWRRRLRGTQAVAAGVAATVRAVGISGGSGCRGPVGGKPGRIGGAIGRAGTATIRLTGPGCGDGAGERRMNRPTLRESGAARAEMGGASPVPDRGWRSRRSPGTRLSAASCDGSMLSTGVLLQAAE